jgi:SAM-dependent methyltransferase
MTIDAAPLGAGQASEPLTDTEHWDSYWERACALPVEATRDAQSSTAAILRVMDRFAVRDSPLSVLELGGAPGGYVAHLHRRFGHDVCVLDNSQVGVELTRKNFELLGIPGRVLQRDLFCADPPIPQFDVVYSLGLIEHFEDTQAIVAAHLMYVRPGGRLIIGCPNLRGVNGLLLRTLSPQALDWHYLDVMDIRGWPRFEEALELSVQFRAYIAGFQPGAFWRCERKSLPPRALAHGFAAVGSRWHGRLARGLSHLNSRHWSYYAMGVYDKPAS